MLIYLVGVGLSSIQRLPDEFAVLAQAEHAHIHTQLRMTVAAFLLLNALNKHICHSHVNDILFVRCLGAHLLP